MSRCRMCGAPIQFIQRDSGRWMPLDVADRQPHWDRCPLQAIVKETGIPKEWEVFGAGAPLNNISQFVSRRTFAGIVRAFSDYFYEQGEARQAGSIKMFEPFAIQAWTNTNTPYLGALHENFVVALKYLVKRVNARSVSEVNKVLGLMLETKGYQFPMFVQADQPYGDPRYRPADKRVWECTKNRARVREFSASMPSRSESNRFGVAPQLNLGDEGPRFTATVDGYGFTPAPGDMLIVPMALKDTPLGTVDFIKLWVSEVQINFQAGTGSSQPQRTGNDYTDKAQFTASGPCEVTTVRDGPKLAQDCTAWVSDLTQTLPWRRAYDGQVQPPAELERGTVYNPDDPLSKLPILVEQDRAAREARNQTRREAVQRETQAFMDEINSKPQRNNSRNSNGNSQPKPKSTETDLFDKPLLEQVGHRHISFDDD